MDKESEHRFLKEFHYIGNNINQLAKKANSGELVSEPSLVSVKEELSNLFRYVMRLSGNAKGAVE
jgi:hypothetical protein